ncbi:MAG: hypothetical protein ABJN42_21635 [Roseibium sp.]|uniref:hypothetical protein n=1 Tax=Roseibium sp. TaxID=1936156 RepID=UPI00329778B1
MSSLHKDFTVTEDCKIWSVRPRALGETCDAINFKDRRFADHATQVIAHWMARHPEALLEGDFEIFCDPSYYDMWCLRPKGSRDFNATVHFGTEVEAKRASEALVTWMADLAAEGEPQ